MLSGLILASVLITDPLDAAAHEPYRLFRVSFRYYLGVARNVSVVQDNSEGSSRTHEAHHLAQVFGTRLCRAPWFSGYQTENSNDHRLVSDFGHARMRHTASGVLLCQT